MYFCKTWRKKISNRLKYFLRKINFSVVCFQGFDSLKQIMILLNGKIIHVIEWVAKTVNRDGKNLRHLKSQKIDLFQSFLHFGAFNLVFICPTLCQLKTTCLLLMKQKLYALDAFSIKKLKLSENDPYELSRHPTYNNSNKEIYNFINLAKTLSQRQNVDFAQDNLILWIIIANAFWYCVNHR